MAVCKPSRATVDLDGRHGLDGPNLGGRWLAVLAGVHTISVRAEGYAAFKQSIEVAAGGNQVVRIGPLRPPQRLSPPLYGNTAASDFFLRRRHHSRA